MKSKLNMRIATPAFAVGVVLGLVLLATLGLSEDPLPTSPTTGPTIVCPVTVKAGGNVCGGASDLDGPIVVKAYLNGVTPLGTDSSTSGNLNTFCFGTGGATDGFVEIRATDSFGNQTTETVDIVNCQ